MSNRVERERELIQSGLASTIKRMYYNAGNRSIPDKYILLMADYIDCVLQVEDSINISAKDLALKLPSVLESVKEANMPNYGVTDKKVITMNSNLSYEQTKLYFFHELTHALQTRLTPNGENARLLIIKMAGFLWKG